MEKKIMLMLLSMIVIVTFPLVSAVNETINETNGEALNDSNSIPQNSLNDSSGLFDIDLTNNANLYIIFTIIIIGGFLSLFTTFSLLGSGIVLLMGLILLFNDYMLLISIVIILLGFVGLFKQ